MEFIGPYRKWGSILRMWTESDHQWCPVSSLRLWGSVGVHHNPCCRLFILISYSWAALSLLVRREAFRTFQTLRQCSKSRRSYPPLQPPRQYPSTEVKVLTNRALRSEDIWESWCINPHILYLDASWRWVVSYKLRLLYTWEKSFRCLLDSWLRGR
jgi:hypothetical protein